MAGSWEHMVTREGRLLNNENFCGMIENLGDAYEAAEECFGMVWWLAGQLADIEDPVGQPARGQVLAIVRQAQESYRDGLRLGGAQKAR